MTKSRRPKPAKRRRGPTPRNPDRSRVVEAPPMVPAASTRYTPKVKARGPFRPVWHKVAGGLIIAIGLGIFVVNDLAWFDINLIPGGHNELWAILGILTAGSSTWWFGWFDRPPSTPR